MTGKQKLGWAVITVLVLTLGLRRVGVGAATEAVLLVAECAILAVFAVAVLAVWGYRQTEREPRRHANRPIARPNQTLESA